MPRLCVYGVTQWCPCGPTRTKGPVQAIGGPLGISGPVGVAARAAATQLPLLAHVAHGSHVRGAL